MKHKRAHIHNVLNSLMLVFKVFSLLTLTTIFLYWSATAIVKFKSLPTSSTVAYRFGDDGHGNIDFPAISICMDELGLSSIAESPNGMKYKCHPLLPDYPKFFEMLKYCTFTTTDGERDFTDFNLLHYYEYYTEFVYPSFQK